MTEQKHYHEKIQSTIFVTCMLVVLAGCSDEITPANKDIQASNPVPAVDVINDKQDESRRQISSDNGFKSKFRYEGVRDSSNPWLLEPAIDDRQSRSHGRQPIGAGKLRQENPWLSPGSKAAGTGRSNQYPSGFEDRNNPWGSSASLERYRQQKDKPTWTQTEKRDNGWEEFPVEDSFLERSTEWWIP